MKAEMKCGCENEKECLLNGLTSLSYAIGFIVAMTLFFIYFILKI